MTAIDRMTSVAEKLIATGEVIEVFLSGTKGVTEIGGIPVEVVEDSVKRRRRFRRLEKKGLAVWLLP